MGQATYIQVDAHICDVQQTPPLMIKFGSGVEVELTEMKRSGSEMWNVDLRLDVGLQTDASYRCINGEGIFGLEK